MFINFFYQPRQTNPDAFLISDVGKVEQIKQLQEIMIHCETKTDPNLLFNLGQNALVN